MYQHFINLFFPHVCAGCNAFLLSDEKVICTACRHNIPLTNHHLNPENEAFMKFYGKLPVEFVVALCYFHKKGIVQEMIHKLKYKGQENIGETFGNWYAEDLKLLAKSNKIDEIIPVPLHKKRLKERGYNQVAEFGKSLADGLQVVYNDKLLIRTVYSKTQTKKDRSGRNLSNSAIFHVNPTAQSHNKHFLLIDDVLTTGATLEACGRALLEIPGAKISIVCIAMSHS